jgi:hypothetical protein
MEKHIAADLMQENLKLCAQLNVIMEKVEHITPDEELRAMRGHLGEVMAAIDLHLFRPLLRQYPDLEPHR